MSWRRPMVSHGALPTHVSTDPGHAGSFSVGGRDGLGGGKFMGTVCGRCYPVHQTPAPPKSEEHVAARRNGRPVMCIETGKKFRSLTMAADSIGKNNANISDAIRRGGTCGGYHWTYIDKEEL